MGAIVSLMKNKQPEIPEMAELSDEDISIIKRTWEIPRAIPLDAGENILLKYFETFPRYQDKFPHFKNIPLLTLKSAPGFRTHAGRIICVFDDTIQLLGTNDYERKVHEIWEKAGQSHYRRTIPIKAFVDLKGVILEVLTYCCYLTSEECNSWDKFFNNIYHELFTTMRKLAVENSRN